MTDNNKGIKIRNRVYDYLTHEISDNRRCIYGWSTWGRGSLEGQPCKSFIESALLDDEAQLLAKYPQAKASHPMLEPKNTFDHLPDRPDY